MTEIVGFTGTRDGMTPQQRRVVEGILHELDPSAIRHGDCRGADAEFHDLARELTLYVIIHPPTNPKDRAWCTGDELLPMKPYLERNKDIVDGSEIMIATPKEMHEQRRGGTWSTIRYARLQQVPLFIVFRDGTLLPRHR